MLSWMEHLLATSRSSFPPLPGTGTRSCRRRTRAKFSISNSTNPFRASASPTHLNASSSRRYPPKNLRYPRRAKVPRDPVVYRVPPKKEEHGSQLIEANPAKESSELPSKDGSFGETDESVWSPVELEAVSALFDRPMIQKPGKSAKDRPLPLPLPYKNRLSEIPTPKLHVRLAARSVLSPRASVTDQSRKNPEILIGIAREIGALPPDSDVSEVLDGWAQFLRKGSLSMTIRELGHMGLPERALQTLCWAQKRRPEFFPDDRVLASTVEVLARNGQLKFEFELEKFLNSASRSVVEAMARGFIRAGNLNRARTLLLLAKENKRTLDPSIHAKLILEAGKTPDGYRLASTLLDELGERERLDLKPQDCTAIMKVCVKLRRFEAVESLFNWFKDSGKKPTVVMYTTVIYSRYCSKRYREGLGLVWEMEALDCLLDLPAYWVVIKLCVALNDLERAVRYFSRLKEAGFAPTYDIYRDMIEAYAVSGRLAKCRKICKEAEMAGLKLDKGTIAILSEVEKVRSVP